MKPAFVSFVGRPTLSFLLSAAAFLFIPKLAAVEPKKAPADAEAAWAEVEKLQQAAHARPEWGQREAKPDELAAFQKQVREANLSLASKAREFAARFPTNENIADARFAVVVSLSRAVAAGDKAAEEEVQQFVAKVLADKSIPQDDRVGIYLMGRTLPLMKKLGMRLIIEGQGKFIDEFDAASIEALGEAQKKFPTSGRVYEFTLAEAERAKDREQQKKLASIVINSEGASEPMKTLARHLFNGTKPYEIGKPLDIRFTALDGREVDLAQLKGKVVLVEFWATDCGPCVGEMPRVRAVYEKLHSRGFELIGISLDDKESALRRFLAEKKLAWPQYFDGKGWQNRFAVQYGIFGIPTMWLVDKKGNLRVTECRGNLETEVEELLEARN